MRTFVIAASVALALAGSAEAKSKGFTNEPAPAPEQNNFMENGTFPAAWQGQYCLDEKASNIAVGKVEVLRRIRNGGRWQDVCRDTGFKISDHGNQEWIEGGCNLLEGEYEEEKKNWVGLYDCGAEATRWASRLRIYSPNANELRIVDEETVQGPALNNQR